MIFKKDNGVPAEVKTAKVVDWYSGLSDQDKMKLTRYIQGSDTSSHFSFFFTIVEKALADENYNFATFMCVSAYDYEMTDYERFVINESLIEAYIGASRFEDAKVACETNLSLYPSISKIFIEKNGGELPKKINFRNRYIDILVGIDSNYDLANEMLHKYNEIGLLDDEELQFRLNSIKTHRLQKIFDGVYTYRPQGEKL